MNKIKAVALEISKKSVTLRNIIRETVNLLKKIKYKINTIGQKVEDKTIIFCCFNGKSYSCSPKAIYEYMSNNKTYEDYKFVWSFKNPEKYKELENNNNTIVIKHNSKTYQKYLASSN